MVYAVIRCDGFEGGDGYTLYGIYSREARAEEVVRDYQDTEDDQLVSYRVQPVIVDSLPMAYRG